MRDVTSAAQSYLIYQPPVAASSDPQPDQLTPARWQDQMGHMVQLFEGGPGAQGTAPVGVVAGSGPIPAVPGRHGQVLSADRFLKADQYEGIHHKSLQEYNHQPRIEGAPNYRDVDGIQGLGQPTVDGIRAVLDRSGSGPGQGGKQAIWTNLRQEPVIYINQVPYNPRDLKHPFSNEAAPGRTAEQVDQREQQLKQDVLDEARQNGGYITLHDEVGQPPNSRIVERQVHVDQVQTVQEVYDGLRDEGYNVKYQRIPITDTKKPEDHDLDALVHSLKDADPEAPLIFNCHAGEGRTTTGMVAASLIRRAARGESGSVLKDKAVRQDIKEQGHHNPRNYRAILNSFKDSKKLLASQADADEVISRYGQVHDLKQSVGQARSRSQDTTQTPAQRSEAAQHTRDYLERYNTILSFDQYLQEQRPGFQLSFTQWKQQHPGIEKNLRDAQLAMATTESAQSALA